MISCFPPGGRSKAPRYLTEPYHRKFCAPHLPSGVITSPGTMLQHYPVHVRAFYAALHE